jgi:hypothetical protein
MVKLKESATPDMIKKKKKPTSHPKKPNFHKNLFQS